jgi:hypothetical protein
MPKKQIHYHKYERMNWPNGKAFYKCMEPNCTHYLPVENLVIGRESLCWGYLCNNLVVIEREDILRKIKHPTCDSCKQIQKNKREEVLKNEPSI